MAMDLSKLSDEDLAALQVGKLDKVSDAGLASLQAPAASPSIADRLMGAITSNKVGKSLSGGLESAVEATPDAALGAAEGATSLVGGAAKVGATGMSAADLAKQAASGKVPDIMGAPAKWREYKQMLQQKVDEASQRSPLAFPVGEGIGMAAATPLIPELGGAKAISAAGKASPLVDQFLAGKAGGLATKVAGKAAAGAIEGAPLGAVMGATGSNASTPEEFASDVGSGIGMSSLGGAAISGGLRTAKAASEYAPELAKKWDFTRKMAKAYDIGKEGQNFDTSVGKSQVGQQLQDIPNKITDQIMEVDGKLGQNVGNSLDPTINPNAAKPINIDDQLRQSSDELFNTFKSNPILLQTVDPKTRALLVKAGQGGLGDLTQLEANALKKSLYDLGSKLQGMSSDAAAVARQQGHSVASALDGALKATNEEYADAATKFSDFRSKIPEVLLQPGLPADKRTKMMGDLKNKATDLYKGAESVFGGAVLPGAPALKQRVGLDEVVNNLQELNKTNPEAVQALGGSPEEVGKNWKDLADKMAVLKQSQGFDPNEKVGGLVRGLVGAGEGMGYNVANRAGRIVSTVGQTAPVQTASKIFNAADDALMTLAQRMKNNQIPGIGSGLSFYGESLEKALNNKNEAGKNAVLFKLMQVPEYREMLKSEGYSDSGSKQ